VAEVGEALGALAVPERQDSVVSVGVAADDPASVVMRAVQAGRSVKGAPCLQCGRSKC
jgi:hypothetical protein